MTEVEQGWAKLPRALRLAAIAMAVVEIVQLGLVLWDPTQGKAEVFRLGLRGLDFGMTLLMVVGTLQASRSIAGTGAGMGLAIAATIGDLVMNLSYSLLSVYFVLSHSDFDALDHAWSVLHYVHCAIAIVGVVGWAIAARHSGLGVAYGAIIVFIFTGDHVLRWLGAAHLLEARFGGILWFGLNASAIALHALLASFAAARNDSIVPPRSPADGFNQISAGLWTGVVAVVVFGFVVFASVHSTSDRPIDVGMMFVTVVGIVGVVLAGLGATSACREPEGAPAGWLVTLGALLLFGACGCAVTVVLGLFETYFVRDGFGGFGNQWQTGALVMMGAAGLGVASALAGAASYARARGEAAASSKLTTALVTYCILMAVASVLLWATRDSGSDKAALMRLGTAGVSAISAAVIAAVAFVRSASLFGTAPQIPAATVIKH
jgi:hypothetical protein|nr:hypothetical protein [Kofleriaceae bacterium]